MRKIVWAALASGAMFAGLSGAASAAPQYPYCTDSLIEGIVCSYNTMQQCQASASGRGIGCIVNPELAASRAYGVPVNEPRRRNRSHR